MASSKLAAARAARDGQKKSASTQVAGIVARPPAATADTIRTNVVVSRDVALRAEERLLDLKRAGTPTSWSGFVEVAVAEMLERDDLPEVVARYGLGLRRK